MRTWSATDELCFTATHPSVSIFPTGYIPTHSPTPPTSTLRAARAHDADLLIYSFTVPLWARHQDSRGYASILSFGSKHYSGEKSKALFRLINTTAKPSSSLKIHIADLRGAAPQLLVLCTSAALTARSAEPGVSLGLCSWLPSIIVRQ